MDKRNLLTEKNIKGLFNIDDEVKPLVIKYDIY